MTKRDCLGFPKLESNKFDLDIFFPGCQTKCETRFRKQLEYLLDSGDYTCGCGCVDGGYDNNRFDVAEDFEFEEAVYSDDIDSNKFGKVEIGSTFDVLSLLSNGGDGGSNHLLRIINGEVDQRAVEVDSLKGKYVVVYCVFVPYLANGFYSRLLRWVSLLSNEISERKDKCDVEMVLVVKMRPQWLHNLDVVSHFVKRFSCLVVPFDDHARIDLICKAVKLGCEPMGVVVGPDQVVIQDSLGFVERVGMDAFPFTDEDICSDMRRPYEKPMSLERVLGDGYVYRKTLSNKREVVSIAELGNKLVGLYLYIDGDYMRIIRDVYRQCEAKGLEFEVVVLCMPFRKTVRPNEIEEAMASVLKRRGLPWWVLPFNNSLFHRLFWRSFHDISDRLFIVLPNGKLMDPYGAVVALHFGIEAYPFTRETVFKKALDKIRPLTLESSLLGGSLYRGGDKISVADIQGKNVILCLPYSVDTIKSGVCKTLIKNYCSLKAEDPDLEVVFACSGTQISDEDRSFLSSMSWLLYLRDHSKSEFVTEDLNVWGVESPKLVAFGKDGRICSLGAQNLLHRHGASAFPFVGDLVEEINEDLEDVGKVDRDHRLLIDMVWSGDRSSI